MKNVRTAGYICNKKDACLTKRYLPAIAACTLMSLLLASCSASSLSEDNMKEKLAADTAPIATTAPITTKAPITTRSEDNMIEKLLPDTALITNIYTADPSAHVFDGKLYIYPSHDTDFEYPAGNNGEQYQMSDYHVLSLDNFTSPCKDLGEVLSLQNIPWASKQLWAPDAAYMNGKYYLYFPAKDKEDIFRIGVAVSTSPEGPFTAEESYMPGSFSIDPAVYVEDDKAYMFFGGLSGGQLEHWQSGTYDLTAGEPSGDVPALGPQAAELSPDMLTLASAPQQISIVDENGDPIKASDESRRFFEAVWIHKYNGQYYLSYSTGTTHYLVYAMSDSLMGPYTYKGRILDPVEGWTTHHSIVEFEGKWYLFYHDASLSDGVDSKRCVKYAELTYNEDGTIQKVKR